MRATRRGRQPVRQQQHGHPHRQRRRHPGADRAGQPGVHPAGRRADPADLDRVDRQRRRHRLRRLRQRRAAGQRRRQRADLHRQPAGHRDRVATTCGPRTRPATSSGNSNTVTRTGTGGRRHEPGGGQADHGVLGVVHTFVATNANDNNVATYWEGARRVPEHADRRSWARTPTISSVVVKLNPDSAWGTAHPDHPGPRPGAERRRRSPRWSASATYSFNPATGNTVTIPVSATAADVRLQLHREHRRAQRPGRRVPGDRHAGAEPGPDHHRHVVLARPSPVETDAITLSATVRNAGTAALGRDQRQLLPGHDPGRHRQRRRAGGRRVSAPSRPTSAPRDAGTLPAEREGRRGQHRHRAERRQQHATPTRPRSWSRRSQSSDLVARSVALVAEQPGRRQHGHVLGGHPQPGHGRPRPAARTASR